MKMTKKQLEKVWGQSGRRFAVANQKTGFVIAAFDTREEADQFVVGYARSYGRFTGVKMVVIDTKKEETDG